MHYKVDGLVIKTENGARPISQQNKTVVEWIRSLPESSVVLDYGCGKFRYTIPLSKRVRSVYAVDSSYQIERTQIVNRRKSTLSEYARKYLPNVRVCAVQDEHWQVPGYDRVLCSNVLSAIPDKRKRVEILRSFRPLIKPSGSLFLCTRFRSSYFGKYADNPNAKKYLDGWLISSSRGNSFFGLLPPEELGLICVRAGYNVVECYPKGESAYVVASP